METITAGNSSKPMLIEYTDSVGREFFILCIPVYGETFIATKSSLTLTMLSNSVNEHSTAFLSRSFDFFYPIRYKFC